MIAQCWRLLALLPTEPPVDGKATFTRYAADGVTVVEQIVIGPLDRSTPLPQAMETQDAPTPFCACE